MVRYAKKGHAYTPGLKVTSCTYVKKERLLPIRGEVLVKEGDKVDFNSVVARAYVEGSPVIVKVAEMLGLEPDEVQHYMLKKVGDKVRKGEVIAAFRALFGLIKKEVRSPIDGYIDYISSSTGHVVVKEEPKPIEVKAYIRGRVLKVLPKEGAIVGTPAAFVQGIFGLSGERNGEIAVAVSSREEVLTPDKITEEHSGKIIVGGSLVTYEAIQKAIKVGAVGIVVGGAYMDDLEKLLGYPIGVAITGREPIGITIVLTEGFGKMPMSKRAFNIFLKYEGRRAAISGATQIRAGVIRPEVVIPLDKSECPADESVAEKVEEGIMEPGTMVRIIRFPYFGMIGRVVSLPIELMKIETESPVRVVEVELEDGRRVIVPRANVEVITE